MSRCRRLKAAEDKIHGEPRAPIATPRWRVSDFLTIAVVRFHKDLLVQPARNTLRASAWRKDHES